MMEELKPCLCGLAGIYHIRGTSGRWSGIVECEGYLCTQKTGMIHTKQTHSTIVNQLTEMWNRRADNA